MSLPPVDFVTQAPLIEKEKVLKLLNANFDIEYASITLLSGYDDLNFLLENLVYSKNDEENAEKYGRKLVCKFTNPLEARYPDLLDSQVELLHYLKSNGLPCASLFPLSNGRFYEYVQMNEDIRLPVRIFTFLPGQTMEKFGYSNELYFKIGELVAKFHNLTTDYPDDKWFKINRIPIVLECWGYLENEFKIQCKLGTIKSENITVCEQVFQKFNNIVLQNREQFEEGLIHSDINETNVLLERDGSGEIKITGLIDFGDTHYSLRIFDIAASILYILMDVPTDSQEEWSSIINHYLQGYCSLRKIRDLQLCQLSMCARLIASLIYGLRTVRINARGDDPSYILKTQQKGWKFLHLLADDTKLRLFDKVEQQ